MKRVNKSSLRRLPWLYLIYALFNDLVWIVLFIVLANVESGGVKAMSFFLTLVGSIALPIVSILCIYGLIDLSEYFRKSCYVYLLSMIFLMANMILLFIINMSNGDTGPFEISILTEAREVLQDLRVPMDALAAFFLLTGFAETLQKAKDQRIYRKCNVMRRTIFFLGIVYCVFVLMVEIFSIFTDGGLWDASGLYMAFSLLAIVVMVILVLVDIPVFMILLKAARQTYEILSSREETF